MGYTHFKAPCGTEGLYVGVKGSEVAVVSSSGSAAITNLAVSGNLTVTGTMSATAGMVGDTYTLMATSRLVSAGTSVAATDVYIVSPVAGTVTGYVVASASDATGRTVTVRIGSAGLFLLEAPAAFVISNGTIGTATFMTNTSGTTTIAAGGSMLIAFGSVATVQTIACNLMVTRTV